MSPAASLDLGTNTFRLLIAEGISRNRVSPLFKKRAVTRLGEGFPRGGRIQPAAIERSMAALYDFASIIDHYQVKHVFAVATSVVREAVNGAAFIQQVYDRTGIPVRTLNGSEEARLTLKGVLSTVEHQSKYAAVFDIGGGSTEFMVTEGNRLLKTESIPLGVVFLAETLPTSDPPTARELSRLRTSIRKELLLNDLHGALPAGVTAGDEGLLTLIGTAGTVTTLAAIDQKMEVYDPQTIDNHRLSRKTIEIIYQHLTALTAAERTRLPGLEEGREVVIISGTAIVLEIMDCFRRSHLTVSDAGLLEGVLLHSNPFL